MCKFKSVLISSVLLMLILEPSWVTANFHSETTTARKAFMENMKAEKILFTTIIQVDLADESGVETYHKANSDKIILSFNLHTWEGGSVRLSSFTGKILEEIEIHNRNIGFDLEKASTGFYFITIEKNQHFQVIKIAKE